MSIQQKLTGGSEPLISEIDDHVARDVHRIA